MSRSEQISINIAVEILSFSIENINSILELENLLFKCKNINLSHLSHTQKQNLTLKITRIKEKIARLKSK